MKENNQNENNQSRQILLSVLAVAILVVAVVGISFAAFTYTKQGEKTNTITTGTITMEYTEDANEIIIDNAMPVSDSIGKSITPNDASTAGTTTTGHGTFDFTVKATITGTTTINYQIGAEKVEIETKEPQAPEYSDIGVKAIPDDMVKIYLEKDETGGSSYSAVETTMSSDTVKTYDELEDGSGLNGEVPEEQKVLGSGSFSKGGNATHAYRLRMWVSEKYDMNSLNDSDSQPGKTLTYKGQFKLKVNVYGSAAA